VLLLRVFYFHFCASALPGSSASRYLLAICSLDPIVTVIRLVKGSGCCFPVWV
jgi:hypothetical protein